MKLVLATTNLHKIREIRAILKTLAHIDILSLHDFPDYTPPDESGSTFEENALLKASHAAKTLNCAVIADDSGLVVPALNNEPGIRSARYAGDSSTDHDNRMKLIKEIEKLPEKARVAYYVTVLILATPEGMQKQAIGKCEGHLITSPRGSHGFGYDPIFIKNDYPKTLAELDEELKNRISARRKALDKLIPSLELLQIC